MPYHLRWESDHLYFNFYDQLSFEDVDRSNQEVYSDPRFEFINYILIDTTKITEFIPPKEMLDFIVFIDKAVMSIKPELCLAFIITSGENRESVEYYIKGAKKEGILWDMAIFETVESANKWINSSDYKPE